MSATSERDRRAALANQSVLNAIDFVEVRDLAETTLRVHFQTAQPDRAALAAAVTGATITGGATIPTVAVQWTAAAWGESLGRPWLELTVAAPGDFSIYTLRLATSRQILDPYFDHAPFSFKANCPSDVDCRVPDRADELPEADAVPIDYLAKDFASFKKALSDFSALRYPAWQERSEADFGVMFMEALSSIADDLSYQQDRIAAEAWLETATQRRSLVRLARLVDYEPGVATAARTWLQLAVAGGWSGELPAGLVVSALDPDGSPIDFETGSGLDGPASYFVAAAWNAIEPYWWDAKEQTLPIGATAMWLRDPGLALAPGRRILIDTRPELDGEQPIREIVELAEVSAPVSDPLFATTLIRIAWRTEDAVRVPHDLARTTIAANLVPATHGRRYTERFVTTPSPGSPAQRPATVRTGANRTTHYLYTLGHSPLAWLGDDAPRPELRLVELAGSVGRAWPWRRSLLDPRPPRQVVTIDPVRYRTVDARLALADYDGGEGDTIRFGDGVFGAIPADGAVFEVTYRAGGGARGNVAADSITRVDPTHPLAAAIASVTNPLAADGGRDPEPDERVRELAPEQFRASQFRAVRAEDYERAATGLPWVQRAGTTFRYTGSWLSVFTAVDPRATESLPIDRAIELTELLDRRRLAGYESFVLPPRYAPLDVEVTVCVRADAFRGDVKVAVLAALESFFHPDRFSFGIALERSALEAAVQEVRGVDGVLGVQYRRRGLTLDLVAMPELVDVARDEIVRVDNDPNRPDAGSLRVTLVGGK